MRRIPLETRTLYAELLERLAVQEAERSIGGVPGCLVTKRVKGETYFYFQSSIPGGGKRQAYLGRKSPALDRLAARYTEGKASFREGSEGISRLCAQLRAGGALTTDASSARILAALAAEGIFRLGGILIGTHAFTVMGNLLGFAWEGAALRTQDLDIAGPRVLGIAVTDRTADVPETLARLEMGFLPVPSLNPKTPSTSFSVRGKGLRVDLVTTEARANDSRPVPIPRFNAAAQPLRFLDFLIKDTIPGAVVDGGGVLVNVPAPARFAFHKLIASRERAVSFHAKTEKDLRQAGRVFLALAEDRPGDVEQAWDEVRARGPGWVKRVREAIAAMKKFDPEAHEAVKEALG